jgi:hypothetical protein
MRDPTLQYRAAQTQTFVSLCEVVVEAQITAPAQYVVAWFVRYLPGVEYISITKNLLRGLGMRVLYNSRHPDYMRTKLKDSIRDAIAESDSGLTSNNILAKLNMREPFARQM